MENINFIDVNKDSEKHIKDLYELLKSREFNISHVELPEYDDHKKFVINNPYRTWHFLKKEDKLIGAFYITLENIISVNLINPLKEDYIFIIKKILKKYLPLKEKKSIRSKYFLINTNPNNQELIGALEKLDFSHIQNTYAVKN